MYRNSILFIAMCLITLGAYAQDLVTGQIGLTQGPLTCPCSNLMVGFSTTGTINTGNVYTAELSDVSGSFATPVTIGTLASTATGGTISATIPCNTPTGNGYRIRVTSSDVAEVAADNGYNLIISAPVTPAVTIAAAPGATVCAGSTVTYTSSVTNGGWSPGYYWVKNNVFTGQAGATFVDNAAANNDDVYVIHTSSLSTACATNGNVQATSNHVNLTVNPNLTPAVTIVSDAPGNRACVGANVTFTATPVNGGAAPSYQWKKNGVNVGANSATYSDNTLNNADVITVVLTSNHTCITTATANSNAITMNIGSPVVPSVSINAIQGTSVCNGVAVNFVPVPVNGGVDPTYVWTLNGAQVSTTAAYTNPGTLVNGDVIAVTMTSKAPCPTPATAANNIVMTVVQPTVPSATIAANPGNSICSGTSVTFTATPSGNAGTAPKYQWKRNGVNVGTNSTTYTSSALANFDIITCVITSDAQCPASATSNSIAMAVTPTLAPSATITSNVGPSTCEGAVINFSAQPYAGGTSPGYQWKVDGVNVGTNSAVYFNNGNLSAGNHTISVEITSNYACRSAATGTGSMTLTVKPIVTPAVSISSPDAVNGNICGNASVTFTATPTHGGATPQYQWKKNGVNISTGVSWNAGTTLVAGDVVTCVMTSSEGCVTNGTPVSNAVTIAHYPVSTASVSIWSPYGAVACQGVPVTFAATAANTGTAPTYQWKKNGTNVGTNSPAYTSAIAGGDEIQCIMTSNKICATPVPANSNKLNMTVSPVVAGSVQVYVANDSVACDGEPFVFTSYHTNGGTNPTYQWYKNGVTISGATQAVFSSSSLSNNDEISVEMNSNATCVFPVNSTPISVEVIPTSVPDVKITGMKDIDGYRFYAAFTNGGTSPTYQWRVNGVDIAGATAEKFMVKDLKLTDKVSLFAGSSAVCATPQYVLSNTIEVEDVTGVKNVMSAVNNIRLFPNPNEGKFNLSGTVNANGARQAMLEVVNAIGQVVYRDAIELNGKELNAVVNISAAAPGVYTVRLDVEGNTSAVRFVVK